MENPIILAKTDKKMIKNLNICFYLYYIFRTLLILLKSIKFGNNNLFIRDFSTLIP